MQEEYFTLITVEMTFVKNFLELGMCMLRQKGIREEK